MITYFVPCPGFSPLTPLISSNTRFHVKPLSLGLSILSLFRRYFFGLAGAIGAPMPGGGIAPPTGRPGGGKPGADGGPGGGLGEGGIAPPIGGPGGGPGGGGPGGAEGGAKLGGPGGGPGAGGPGGGPGGAATGIGGPGIEGFGAPPYA